MKAQAPLSAASVRPLGDAAPDSGQPQLLWPAEAIRAAVAPLLPGFRVEVLARTDSTNSELMRRARAGRTEPVLLVTEQQSAGRGRLGRGWASGRGESLTFSLGLALAPPDWSGLSLAVGVSLAESLDGRIRLKWPNDLWLDDRKMAGILIETAGTGGSGQGRYAVVGVGINLTPRSAAGLATPPAWLAQVLPGCDPGAVLLRVAAPLVQAIQAFECGGFAAFRGRFAARDALLDRAVLLSDGTTGTGRGITEGGALRVQTAAGLVTVTSSEVSVRPAN